MSLPNFFSLEQRNQLLENGIIACVHGRQDPTPVVKLGCPALNATWLLAELDPDNPEIAFGLRFVGRGLPELGYVDLRALAKLQGQSGTAIECDASFVAQHPLSVYVAASRAAGRVVTEFKDCP